MNHRDHFPAVLLSLITLVGFTGCVRDSNRWTAQDAAAKPADVSVDQAGGNTRIVLFPPVALGALASINPNARLAFAHDMANRIDLLGKDADGRVGESLPESGSTEWDHGRVAAAGAAHLVVLTKVVELRRVDGAADVHGVIDRQIAVIEVRAIDVDGRVVLSRQVKGEAPVARSGKFIGPANEPESLATWQALSTACGLINTYLAEHQDLRSVPKQEVPNGINLIDVAFDSDPSKADILIDGAFRGTTPQVLPLPGKEVTVSIERQGYQPWTRKLMPVTGMKIQPALVALPPAAKPDASETK
jgi:PEGA domain